VDVGPICHAPSQAAACGHRPQPHYPATRRPVRSILFRSQVRASQPAAGLGPTDSVFAFEKTPSPPHRLKERTFSSNCFGSTWVDLLTGASSDLSASSFMAIRLNRISLSRFEPALFKSF